MKVSEKTVEELAPWAMKRKDRVLLVTDEKEVDRVCKDYSVLGNRHQVMTLRTYMRRSPSMPRVTQVAVVEAETILKNFIRHNIQELTLNLK